MPNPIVSICVANYQGAAVIQRCLASLFSQQSSFLFEVIVYDDASTDCSWEIVANEFPKARLIRGASNVGYCQANWVMANEAKGKYLLLFNNDAWLKPGSLQALFSAAESLHQPAVLGLPQYDARSGRLEDRGRMCDLFLNAIPNLDSSIESVAMVAGACLWLPREQWFEFGGFPVWFEYTAEDLYLCTVARLHGCPVRVLQGDVGFFHCIGHSIGGGAIRSGRMLTTARRRFRTERNKAVVLWACYPAPWHLFGSSLLIMSLVLEGGALSLLKRSLQPLREVYLPALFDLWRKRQRISEMRRFVHQVPLQRTGFFKPFSWVPYKWTMLYRYGVPDIN